MREITSAGLNSTKLRSAGEHQAAVVGKLARPISRDTLRNQMRIGRASALGAAVRAEATA